MNRPPPPPGSRSSGPPQRQRPDPDEFGDGLPVGTALSVLLGVAAWFGSFAAIAGISDKAPDEQITYLAASIALSVVGATFLIIAVLIAHR